MNKVIENAMCVCNNIKNNVYDSIISIVKEFGEKMVKHDDIICHYVLNLEVPIFYTTIDGDVCKATSIEYMVFDNGGSSIELVDEQRIRLGDVADMLLFFGLLLDYVKFYLAIKFEVSVPVTITIMPKVKVNAKSSAEAYKKAIQKVSTKLSGLNLGNTMKVHVSSIEESKIDIIAND